MSTLGEALVEYLELRRGLGFKMQAAGLQLPRFVGFLERQQTSFITTRLALEWSQEPASVQPAEWATALELRIELPRHCDGSGVDVLYCIELRASLIVGFDAREIVLDEGDTA